jgi:hypothetical protein
MADVSNEARDPLGRWTRGGGAPDVGHTDDKFTQPQADFLHPYQALAGVPFPIEITGGPFVVVDDVSHAENARRIALAATDIAKREGFDPTKINVTDREEKFKLNGMDYNKAGRWPHYVVFTTHGRAASARHYNARNHAREVPRIPGRL